MEEIPALFDNYYYYLSASLPEALLIGQTDDSQRQYHRKPCASYPTLAGGDPNAHNGSFGVLNKLSWSKSCNRLQWLKSTDQISVVGFYTWAYPAIAAPRAIHSYTAIRCVFVQKMHTNASAAEALPEPR